MFQDKGLPESTAVNQVLEIQSKFNYRNVLSKFMYMYMHNFLLSMLLLVILLTTSIHFFSR